MKGKINKYGVLSIKRGGRERCDSRCHMINEVGVYCGDNCALFGEPVQDVETGLTWLSLCHKSLSFDEFTDERE